MSTDELSYGEPHGDAPALPRKVTHHPGIMAVHTLGRMPATWAMGRRGQDRSLNHDGLRPQVNIVDADIGIVSQKAGSFFFNGAASTEKVILPCPNSLVL